jgi:hypothetical protein
MAGVTCGVQHVPPFHQHPLPAVRESENPSAQYTEPSMPQQSPSGPPFSMHAPGAHCPVAWQARHARRTARSMAVQRQLHRRQIAKVTFVKLTYQFRPYQIARGATTATRGTTSSAVRGTPRSVPSRCTPCCWATNKDKVSKSTSPLVSYNSTHATDIVEPGGGPGGSDRLFEAKVVSPCTLAERQGAVTRGQKQASRRSGATYSASATPPSSER